MTARRSFARLPRERRVGDILDAARSVFAEHGYENAGMSTIAEQAGVVEGTIYKYFANKRDLLNQVLSRWYEGMVADQNDQLAGIVGTRSRLRFVIWRHLKTIATEPALCRVFFLEVRAAGEYHASDLHVLNRGYTRAAVAILREGIATGEVRPDIPVRLVRDIIYGTIEHHTWDYVCGRGGLHVEELADDLTRVVLSGIGSRCEAEPGTADRLERVADRLETLMARAGRDGGASS
ncbi:MAG: TetR/AcrR family transcriptional regulator [Enterovirga sp.]|nr:TetR/AcrR family transcriptional regulator [Enterovirga sp.]